jgi:hypothetical protein
MGTMEQPGTTFGEVTHLFEEAAAGQRGVLPVILVVTHPFQSTPGLLAQFGSMAIQAKRPANRSAEDAHSDTS